MAVYQVLKSFFLHRNIPKLPLSTIVVYHYIGFPEPNNPLLLNSLHWVSTQNFINQVQYLKKNYTLVTVNEITQQILNKKSIQGLAAITFDDGYNSVFSQALPFLEAENIPASVYISANIVEHKWFWRDAIRLVTHYKLETELIAFAKAFDISLPAPIHLYKATKRPQINSNKLNTCLQQFLVHKNINIQDFTQNIYATSCDIQKPYKNIEMGNHTESHFVLSSLSDEQQYHEIQNGYLYLKNLDIKVSNSFAVPFGYTNSINPSTIQIIDKQGYNCILMCNGYEPSSINENLSSFKSSNNLAFLQRFMPTNEAFNFKK